MQFSEATPVLIKLSWARETCGGSTRPHHSSLKISIFVINTNVNNISALSIKSHESLRTAVKPAGPSSQSSFATTRNKSRNGLLNRTAQRLMSSTLVISDTKRAKRQKHTTGGIPRWSPTLVLVARFSAYVWQSGRDAQFSLTYGRMCQSSQNLSTY